MRLPISNIIVLKQIILPLESNARNDEETILEHAYDDLESCVKSEKNANPGDGQEGNSQANDDLLVVPRWCRLAEVVIVAEQANNGGGVGHVDYLPRDYCDFLVVFANILR